MTLDHISAANSALDSTVVTGAGALALFVVFIVIMLFLLTGFTRWHQNQSYDAGWYGQADNQYNGCTVTVLWIGFIVVVVAVALGGGA